MSGLSLAQLKVLRYAAGVPVFWGGSEEKRTVEVLVREGLLEYTTRQWVRITEKGRSVVAERAESVGP